MGWITAKINDKFKYKNFITVFFSLIFFMVYYVFIYKYRKILTSVILAAEKVGTLAQNAFPIYFFEKACTGDFLCLLIVIVSGCLLMTLTIYLLKHNFIKMTTFGTNVSYKKYVKTKLKSKSLSTTLLQKELRRFISSSSYMINCGFSSFLIVIMCIFSLIYRERIGEGVRLLEINSDLSLLFASMGICFLCSMNSITAPSISLEGDNLWIIKSLPISVWSILAAKVNLHLLIVGIPSVLGCVCIAIVLKLNVFHSILMIVVTMLFVIFSALLGIFFNLKFPKLNWKNEIIPIKQSLSVFFTMFGNWTLIIVFCLLYFKLQDLISTVLFLGLCCVLIVALILSILMWIKTKSSKIFYKL